MERISKHPVLSLGTSYSVICIRELNGTLFINSNYVFIREKNILNFGLYKVQEKEGQTTYIYKPLFNSDTFFEESQKPTLFGYFINEIKFEKITDADSTKIVFILSFCRTIHLSEILSIVREINYDYKSKVNHEFVLSNPIHFIPDSTIINIGFSHFRENPSSKQFKICNDRNKLIPFRLIDADYIANRIAGHLSNVIFNIYEEGKYRPGDNHFYTVLECRYYKAYNFFDDYISYLLKKALKENEVVNEDETSIFLYMGYEYAYSPSFSRRLTKENDNSIRIKYSSRVAMMYKLSEHYEFFSKNWDKYKIIYEKDE